MKNILTLLLLGTLSTIFAQNNKFTQAEIDTILAFDEGSALSKVDTVQNVIQFRTPTFILLAIKNFDYRVDLDMRFDVVKVDGQICLESLNLYQNVSREGFYSYDKLVFIVERSANKFQIKQAIENLYSVKIIKINTLITPTGEKKALVKLHPNDSAADLAIKLGIF